MESLSATLAYRKSLSVTTLIGLIFGLISFSPLSVLPLPFIGLLLCIVGLIETGQRYGKRGRGMTVAGLVLNSLAILWFISYSTDNFGF